MAIGIKRNPNTGNACGHTSQCEHKNHIHTHKHTLTHTCTYVCLGLRKETNYKALRYILFNSSLLISLSLTHPNNILSTPWSPIPITSPSP